jgi:signal transduction histidine kinase
MMDSQNMYSFTLKRQPITLVPLTPKQVMEDHLKLQRSNEKKKKKKKKKKRKAEIEKKSEKERERISAIVRAREEKFNYIAKKK